MTIQFFNQYQTFISESANDFWYCFNTKILKSHPFKIIFIQLSNWHEFFSKRMFTPSPEKSFPRMHDYVRYFYVGSYNNLYRPFMPILLFSFILLLITKRMYNPLLLTGFLVVLFFSLLCAQEEVQDSIYLNSGFNLISFNVLPDDTSVENMFSPLGDNILSIIGEGLVAVNVQGSWIGSLNYISPDKGYWIHINEPDFLYIEGYPIDPEQNYYLHDGPNLISYPFNFPINISHI